MIAKDSKAFFFFIPFNFIVSWVAMARNGGGNSGAA